MLIGMNVFVCMCINALHYVCPCVFCLFCTDFLHKTKDKCSPTSYLDISGENLRASRRKKNIQREFIKNSMVSTLPSPHPNTCSKWLIDAAVAATYIIDISMTKMTTTMIMLKFFSCCQFWLFFFHSQFPPSPIVTQANSMNTMSCKCRFIN